MGYQMSAATPSRALLLARLASLPSLPGTVIRAQSRWATEGDAQTSAVLFEADEDLVVGSSALEFYWDAGGRNLYVGHRTLPFAGFTFNAGTYASGIDYRVEFYDGGLGGWQTLQGVADGTESLTKAGSVEFDPAFCFSPADTYQRRWVRTTVNGIEAYWIVFRKIGVHAPISPSDLAIAQKGSWYAAFWATQGETVVDTLGTTDGSNLQAFRLNRSPLVQGSISVVAVGDDQTWTSVESLFGAGPADRVYEIQERTDGFYVIFGDDTNGQKPLSGQVIAVQYRIGADDDGNVGIGTITINRSSTPRIADVTNPAPAAGWAAPEGAISGAFSTEAAALARWRVLAPAAARSSGRAVTLEDFETLSVKWRSSDGRSPVARAYAIENGAGPRSIVMLVCGPAGTFLEEADRSALEIYLQGSRVGTQMRGGKALCGVTVVVQNFTPVTVDVTMTMRVLKAYATVAKAAAESAVSALLSPLALDSDGANWRWMAGRAFSDDPLRAAAGLAVQGFFSFDSFTPASLVLGPREWPVAGVVTANIVEVT